MTKHCRAVDRHSLALAVFRGSNGRWTILLCHYDSITRPSAPAKLSSHGVFAANGSKFQMRAITRCPEVQPGQTLCIRGSAKTQTVLSPLLLTETPVWFDVIYVFLTLTAE